MKQLTGIACVVLLSACATEPLTLTPTGGSRADGVIYLSTDVGVFSILNVDWEATTQVAAQRCRSWGYRNAQPFGGESISCIYYDINGACNVSRYTYTFQCSE